MKVSFRPPHADLSIVFSITRFAALSIGLSSLVSGQSNVYWRDAATSGYWVDSSENRWYRSSDGFDIRREDLIDGQFFYDAAKTPNIVHFGNGSQVSMTINGLGGTEHQIYQILFENSSNRSFAQADGAYLKMTGGSGNAKIEAVSGSGTGTYTFNVPITLGKLTEFKPEGGNLTFGSTITNSGFNIDVTGTASKSLSLSGDISGSGGIVVKSNTNVSLTNTKSYTGITRVEAGTLGFSGAMQSDAYEISGGSITASADNLVKDSASISITGGTLNLQGSNTIGSISATGGNIAISSSKTISITSNSSIGTGTAMTGGTLRANAGTLTYNAVGGTSSVTVESGAKLAGSGTIGGATTIHGKHAPGNGGVGVQAFQDNLTYSGTSIFEWDLSTASTSNGFDTVTGAAGKTFSAAGVFRVITDLNFSADTFWDSQKTWSSIFSGFGTSTGWSNLMAVSVYGTNGTLMDVSSHGSFSIQGTQLTWTAVPEPNSALAGLLVAAGLIRRRR